MILRLVGGCVAATVMVVAAPAPVRAQAVAHPEQARPVQGDPGISSSQVLSEPQYRVLRDYAEPGATRRNHNHPDATYHVFVLITGKLRLTVEGQAPVEVNPGEALALKGGVMHTFTNIGTVTATIVEVFGKAPAAAADAAFAEALARALAPPGPGR
ncbi:MAG: cupin domain-containing protein [Vicinamibacterales bacterium]